MKRRVEFLAIRGGAKWSTPGFVLETKARSGEADGPPRFGFTVTRQLGSATVRNRIRRRLKEALRTGAMASAHPGFDYVVIGRKAALAREFADLAADFETALAKVHRKAPRPAKT